MSVTAEVMPEVTYSGITIPEIHAEDDGQRAAFRYVNSHLYIGPCAHGSKSPGSVLGKGWPSKTFSDSEHVVMWWEEGDFGVFLHAGRSGCVILDVDDPSRIPAEWWPYLDRAPFQSSRPGVALRGHYVFACPPGRSIGNAIGETGRLGWGEVRGLNGVIIVAPTRHEKHAEGAEYHWVRTGPVPFLPALIADTLPEGKPGEACATDSEIDAFFAQNTAEDKDAVRFKTQAVAKYHADVEAGRSRHEAGVAAACWIAREGASGWYNAREAMLLLFDAFRGSFTEQERKQFRGGKHEFRAILSWAIGQITPDDIQRKRADLDRKRNVTYLQHRRDREAADQEGSPVSVEDEITDSWMVGEDGSVPSPRTSPESTPAVGEAAGVTPDPDRYYADKTIGLNVALLADDVMAAAPCALGTDRDGVPWVYEHGVFRPDEGTLSMIFTQLLGPRYRKSHETNGIPVVLGRLRHAGRKLPHLASQPVLNVKNGMLDLRTMELLPHSPEWQSTWQIPVAWDPDATCPTYDQWLMDVLPDQADDFEETVSQMLDASSIPRKAMLLYGPSRSGKSTAQRLACYMIGDTNRSAVALDHLTGTDHKFKVAEMHGKRLNSSGDLPVMDVADVALFKQLTGGDPVTVEKKGRQPFAFINQAMMLFSANTVPAVGETSDAYMQRMRPFSFNRSFAGHEDRTIEQRMVNELPGILVRWVRAWQRMDARGDYTETAPDVAKEFAIRTNRVRQFIEEVCQVNRKVAYQGYGDLVDVTPNMGLTVGTSTPSKSLYDAYCRWASDAGMKSTGRNTFFERLRTMADDLGLVEVRCGVNRTRGWNVTLLAD